MVFDGVVAAPVLMTPMPGGKISLRMGDGEPGEVQRQADEMVAVLIGGPLPTGVALDWSKAIE